MSTVLWGMGAMLLGSACFSGSEAALFTLASSNSNNSSNREDVPRVARRLLEDQVGALTTILLLNLLVNLGFFAVAHAWSRQLEGPNTFWVDILAIVAIVLFGEVLPKVMAHRFPRAAASVLLLPVSLAHVLLGRFLRPLGRNWGKGRLRQAPLDSGQTADLLSEAEGEVLEDSEFDLITHVLELGELRAGALRRAVADLPRLDVEQDLQAAIKDLIAQGQPWAAAINSNGDVLGLLDRTRPLLGKTVADAMRSVPILPEVAPVANGVQLLRASGGPFVLLVDEYGQSVGVIERGRWADTLLDRLPGAASGSDSPIRPGHDGCWEVDAGLPLHDFIDRFGDPGEFDVRLDTIGGLVAEKLGRMAEVEDLVVLDGSKSQFEIRVASCSETRPLTLEVRVLHSGEALSQNEETNGLNPEGSA
jgi:CBS domain containing-hemolysin-like protein